MKTKTCIVCGNGFTVKNYREQTAKFCSRSCGGKWYIAHRPPMPHPHIFGNKYRLGIPPTNKGKPSPQRGVKLVPRVVFTCAYCGKTVERIPWLHRQNTHSEGKNRFCNSTCHNLFVAKELSGENSPLYCGGITTYRGKGWIEARNNKVKEQGGFCQMCGIFVGHRISVHHIIPFRKFQSIAEANAQSNLICLCQSCHMKTERISDLKR